jgi:hypothetical protein
LQIRFSAIFFLALFFAGFQNHAQINILFVGNSLTYSNDLPGLLEKLAKADGMKIRTQTIAFPNYALEDHWNETSVSEALKKTKFTYVIFQQGPSAMPASRTNLIEYALKFGALCKANNTKQCMYMVWPSGDRSFDFENVIKSYSIAADTVRGLALPVGRAWKKLLDERKDFPLYSADGFHPTIHGSFLAALVIYATLFDKSDLDFLTLKNVPSSFIKETDLDLMKRVALESLKH